ncbi:unnamed protein product, partial [Staurois parvus]
MIRTSHRGPVQRSVFHCVQRIAHVHADRRETCVVYTQVSP